MFKGKSIEELDILMEELKQAKKDAIAKEQSDADAVIRESLLSLTKGNHLTVLFKGEEVEVIFDKLTEKRATVLIDGIKRSVQLDKIISVA